jgi:hypothetical protein
MEIPLGRMEGGTPTIAWWLAVSCLIATTTVGFVFTTKPLSRRQRLAAAVVYYPVVIALSLYAGLIVVGRLYDNYL